MNNIKMDTRRVRRCGDRYQYRVHQSTKSNGVCRSRLLCSGRGCAGLLQQPPRVLSSPSVPAGERPFVDPRAHGYWLLTNTPSARARQRRLRSHEYGTWARVEKEEALCQQHAWIQPDLSYIPTGTPVEAQAEGNEGVEQLIAMGFPSGGEAMYRNPMREVRRFFSTFHQSHFKVYNLCSGVLMTSLSSLWRMVETSRRIAAHDTDSTTTTRHPWHSLNHSVKIWSVGLRQTHATWLPYIARLAKGAQAQ